ncbi:hypothetical protein HanLR1_Chr09g0308041 [Helianthus annuus]|nr:hypothetical protein HanHA89_Chr09g0328591 [Helianthus annuus]KAJ0706527.1 hypothetical protein HanLR1_Chr09g0308041 [Helianthus annuus]
MAEPSNTHNVEGENPEHSSLAAAEEDEDDGGAASGGGLPEGDTGVDAPAGYLTPWAEFFYDGLLLPLTVFVAEVLEFYQIHISQLSPFGMFRIRNFEYTFRALGLEISVPNFRRFYQLTVNTGFFSFNQWYGSPKLMTPPKGITKWKRKFLYVKAVTVHANMTLRNVNEGIPAEDIAIPTAKSVDWFFRLKPIELKRLDNNALWVLRIMLTRPDRKARPILREKSGENAPLWRMFESTFEGKVELVPCGEREGFNLEIVGNFRVPPRNVLNAPMPEGNLGVLGKFEVRTVPKKHVDRKQVKKPARGRGKEKPGGSVATPLVWWCGCRWDLCGSDPAGEKKRKPEEKAAGAGEIKRRRIQTKRSTGVTQKKPAASSGKRFITSDFSSLFDAPLSPAHETAADAGVNKEFTGPFVKVVSEPSVQVEGTGEKVRAQIFDTVDSSNNLITPTDTDDLNLRFSDVGKQKSDAEKHKSPTAEKVCGSASGGAGYEGPPIQPGESELEYYYRTYTDDRVVAYHRPPWSVLQGDDVSNNPSFCKEILGGVGTSFKVNRARALPRELRVNQLSSMLVGSSIMANSIMEDYQALGRKEEETARLRAEAEELVKAARAGAEQLEKDKAAFEKHKQTEEWAATAELKQVRTLAKLLSDERKSWNEKLSDERKSWKVSWAKQNETLFRVRQELINVKAAKAALGKEKAAAEAVVGKAREAEARAAKALEEAKEVGARAAKALEEAKEREGRVSKALEEANADRTRLNQTVGSLQAEGQSREAMLAEVTARATEAETRASEAAEARDSLTSSFNQLETDREWMRCHGIAHIVRAILDAPEIATGIDVIKQRARYAGFKAGYNRCIGHMNILAQGEYIDERSGFHGVNTEALLEAATASFYDMSISALEKLDECLDAEDYVDRLRMLYAGAEESEEEQAAGDGKDGAGSSGTK